VAGVQPRPELVVEVLQPVTLQPPERRVGVLVVEELAGVDHGQVGGRGPETASALPVAHLGHETDLLELAEVV